MQSRYSSTTCFSIRAKANDRKGPDKTVHIDFKKALDKILTAKLTECLKSFDISHGLRA